MSQTNAARFGRGSWIGVLVLSFTALLSACGDESESTSSSSSSSSSSTSSSSSSTSSSSSGMAAPGTIEVTVDYPMGMHAITDKDVLLVAAFPAGKPPTVPVVYFTIKTDAAAMTTLAFPAKDTLKDVPVGAYDVLAILDIDGNNPTVPGPEDLMAQSMMPLEIKGGEMLQLALTLKD